MTPLAVLAAVAATIGGGTYQGKVDSPCDSTCIARLVVVDDGRSLTTRSFVGAPCDFAETTTADSKPAPRGTPVRGNGSFRWKTRYQVVEGKFAADGKSVSGTTRFLGRARGDCSAATFTFTAPLKRHVKPNGRCEPVDTHGLEVQVFARGCTKATRVVDAWSAKRGCPRAAGVPGRRAQLHAAARRAAERARERGLPARADRARGEQGVRRRSAGWGRRRRVRQRGAGDQRRLQRGEGRGARRSNSARCPSHSCTAAGWHCGRPHGDPAAEPLPARARRRGHPAAADHLRRPDG